MAATFVQAVAGAAATSGKVATAQYASNVAAGNLLVAIVSRTVTGSDSPAVTITDDQNNRWKQANEGVVPGAINTHDHGCEIWYCESAIGGARPTVTATLQGFPNGVLGRMVLWVGEYAGGAGGLEPHETSGILGTTTTTVTATTRDSCSANDLLISVMIHNGSAATVPSTWNSRVNDTTTKFAVADLLDSGTAGTKSAAWTGITGNTKGYCIIVAFKPGGTRTSGQPRLMRFQYRLEELFASTTPLGTARSPAFVSPTPGNTLILYTSPYAGNNVVGVTDDHGNRWAQLYDGDYDPWGQGQNSLWICRSSVGAATTITLTATLTKGRGPQLWNQTFWVLMEYVNLPADADILTSGIVLSYLGTGGVGATSVSIPTAASVPASTLVLAFLAGGSDNMSGLDNSAGWLTHFADSGANVGVIEKLTAGSGVQTAGWSWTAPQVTSAFVVALGSRTPTSSGIVTTQARAPIVAPSLPGSVGQRAESIEWEVLESDHGVIGIVTPISPDASIRHDVSSDIIRTTDGLQLAESDCNNMNMLTTRLRPVWVMDDLSRWPLGVYLFSAADRHPRSMALASYRSMSMYDQNSLLLDKRLDAFGLSKSANIRNAMIQLIEEVQIPSYDIGATGAILGDDLAWPAGTPRLTILRHLCAVSGLLRPYFNNDGTLVIRAPADLDSSEPDIVYDTGPSGRIEVESIVTAKDLFDAPNVFLASASGASDGAITAYAYVPASQPHSMQNRGRQILEVLSLPGLTDSNAGFAAAQAAAAQRPSDFVTYEYAGAPDPRHDTYQIIAIDGTNYREISWGLPLKKGSSHTHSLRLAYTLVQDPSSTAPSGVGGITP